MRYEAVTEWSGSTGAGWAAYDRTHVTRAEPATQELVLTTGESRGNPDHLNPEQLLLMAASSCQMLWFLHLAAKARLDVTAYRDECEARMPTDRITEVVLRPRITIRGEFSAARVDRLCELAHRECNIAKSLAAPILIEPEIEADRQR
jgi:organic hydroperoxide reductase OsmC/OhrA